MTTGESAPELPERQRWGFWGWWATGLAVATGPLAFGLTQAVRPSWVEAHYALGIGQPLAGLLGRATGLAPFSVVEMLIYVVIGGLFVGIVAAMRTEAGRARRALLPRWGLRGLVALSCLYAVFVLVWGLDYRRQPIIGRFGFHKGPPTHEEIAGLAIAQVDAVNAARVLAHEDADGVATFATSEADAFDHVAADYDRAAARWPFLGGRYCHAKPVQLSLILSYAGVGGVYSPFTGEPNVNVGQPAFDIPFSIAHETAHQRGIAREDEANFVAWILLRDFGDPDERYSALLEGAYYAIHAYGQLDRPAARGLWDSMSPGVQRDIAAEDRWRARYTTPLAEWSADLNSAYLKSNGVKDGVESYGRMVDLMVAERR